MTTNAILAEEMQTMPPPTPAHEEEDARWQAVLARDGSRDGQFVFAVASTGVYCRPSCAARRPRRENVQFFPIPEAAERAGYRACLRCRPRSFSGSLELQMARAICRYIEQHLDEPVTLDRLGKEFQQSPSTFSANSKPCWASRRASTRTPPDSRR